MHPNAHLHHLASKRRIAVTLMGQRTETTAWTSGDWAARETSVCGVTCWSVFRLQEIGAGGGTFCEIVSGLAREVAIRIVQDMAAVDAEAVSTLAELQAVLRKYLGSYAL